MKITFLCFQKNLIDSYLVKNLTSYMKQYQFKVQNILSVMPTITVHVKEWFNSIIRSMDLAKTVRYFKVTFISVVLIAAVTHMSIVQFFCWKRRVWQAYALQMCKNWNWHPRVVISSPLGRYHCCVKFGGWYTDFLFHRNDMICGWAARLPTVNKIFLPCAPVETPLC